MPSSAYSFIRLFLLPFFFVFGVIFCSLSLPFLRTGLSFYSLVLFSFLYGLIFAVPFLFDNLLSKYSKHKSCLGAFSQKALKLSCISVVTMLFTGVTAATIQAATLQSSNASLLATPLISATTTSLCVISAILAGLFSFTFYFTEPTLNTVSGSIDSATK